MIRSIRKFLLVNLLLTVTLVTSLAVIGNLFLEHKRFLAHLDAQLTLAAYTIQSFLDVEPSPEEIKSMQQRINDIPEALGKINYEDNLDNEGINVLLRSIQFQVWNQHNHLILTSYAARDMPMIIQSDNVGFDNVWKNKVPWRVFSIYNPSTHYHIVVMQPNTTRVQLEKQITWDTLMVMAIIYPFLGLLIWIIVGRGLESVTKTAKELKRRSNPNRLKPIRTTHLPEEIRPMVEELNHLFVRLQKAFLREKRFASDAAHELRTPLAGISIQAELIKDAKNDQERQDAAGKMQKSVDNCSHVIQQLLTLSRMMPESTVNEPIKLNLNALIRQTAENLDAIVTECHSTIDLQLCQPVGYLMGNKTAILILLRNVIDNALRYSPDNTHITVISETNPQHTILKVIDQGAGIGKELQERVFERFYRGNQTSKNPGSGLGLGIVKQIADLHKAIIKLEKCPGDKGFVFSIWFKRHHP